MTVKKNKKDEIKDVQPIRSLEKIEDMKWSLKRHCSERDYILFLLGINTGLRVSDLLNLKISDIKGKKKIAVKEGKTKKGRTIHLANIYEELNNYIGTIQDTEWLFPSRKGDKPISRIQAYRQLNKASQMVDMIDGIGTHTMRKTFGYWYYKRTMNVAKLQMILNHSHPQITLKYIGITDEEIEESLSDFVL
ncbi:site-specific integrase [Bacillus pseudomycoides]|uniref:tyrosine-type recombinase/integrase n=1 Tax=Bacillus pseudomycoides TaxID=64104 RepID=UPI000BECFC69|nr:tyrosine-type recombinase/integrase [Bacillus pseudomycoides]PDX99846.1 site-specific integrase [Bacillus pseudomycoides]PEK82195.1 site-specific integrase [Bacillus pseudomycoides]PEN09870.1 site-specific integrase [Bacillus pseudomycoides]PGB88173.1 site-specific integrase [Bacillus pseudomycoides]PHG29270.1 site-specific integrase [Bacillus pseudomycoides]